MGDGNRDGHGIGSQDEALGLFAARVGNEIRNPLAAVLAAHEYLRRRIDGDSALGKDPKVRHFLDIIEIELGNASRITSDLLDYGGARGVERSAVLVRELFEEARRAVRLPPGVSWKNEVADALPPVHLDKEKTRRALTHLLQNACDAVVAAGGGEVVAGAEIGDGFIVLRVEDDGPGVDASVLPRMREPLFSTKAKGTGLGLPISEALARAQGGELSYERREGRGSRFLVKLPTR